MAIEVESGSAKLFPGIEAPDETHTLTIIRLKSLPTSEMVTSITLVPAASQPAGATLAHVVFQNDVIAQPTPELTLRYFCRFEPLCYDTMDAAARGFRADHAETLLRETQFNEARAAVEEAVARGEKPESALTCENDSLDEMFGDGNESCQCFGCTYEPPKREWPSATEFSHPAPPLPTHVQFAIAPRFKDSYVSGSEWRHEIVARYTLPASQEIEDKHAQDVRTQADYTARMTAFDPATCVVPAWYADDSAASYLAQMIERAATHVHIESPHVRDFAASLVPRPRRAFLYRSMEEALACVFRDAYNQGGSEAWHESGGARFDPASESTFSERACMHPGCNGRADALFRIKEEKRPDGSEYEGTAEATRIAGGHRLFCAKHAQRGNQHAEDRDENYDLVWKRADVALAQRPQGHTVRTVILGA